MDGAIDVFLVPKTMHEHHWDGDRLFGQDLIHGLALPKRIVGRMLFDLSIKANLIQAISLSHLIDRPDRPPRFIVVEMIRPIYPSWHHDNASRDGRCVPPGRLLG